MCLVKEKWRYATISPSIESRNLPSSKEDKEDEEAGKLEESKDDLMLDVEGPMDPIEPPPSNKRRPSWLRDTLEDAERHIAPRGTFRENSHEYLAE